MEPESLEVEEKRNEIQDSDSNGRVLGVADVLTLEEIANLAAEEGQPAETLMNVVALIAKRFDTDVCSAYLLEPDRANLVLAATVGLRRECIGQLRMAIHEGLAGLVAEQVRPVAVESGVGRACRCYLTARPGAPAASTRCRRGAGRVPQTRGTCDAPQACGCS